MSHLQKPWRLLAVMLVLGLVWQAWRQAARGDAQPAATPEAVVPTINVQSLGARGDGSADDTAAIQAAVDRGGAIVFPRGVYRLTAPIVVRLDRTGYISLDGQGVAQLVMEGVGPAIRFVGTHAGSADPATFEARVWQRERAPRVTRLEIVGRHAEATGIEASGTMQLTVAHVALRQLLHGVHLVERNRNVVISDCQIYDNRGVGVFYDGVNLHQSNISGCHISYCRGGGIVVRGGDVRNVQINGCDIEANQDPRGPATANVLLDCRGGSVAEVAIAGCTIQHSAAAPGSANIRMLGASHYRRGEKQVAAQWGNLTIANNVISDAQQNIDLVDVRGAAITGNTIWHGGKFNLRLSNCAQLAITGNVCERNPPYDAEGPAENGVLLDDCRDAVLASNHFHGIAAPVGVLLRHCRRVNVTGCNIVDCTGVELELDGTTHCRVSDCLLRDDREAASDALVLKCNGGEHNLFADNLVGGRHEIARDAGVVQGNHVAP